MQVVLNQDFKGLGYKGEVVNVKRGYYRNFLLPRAIAELATPSLLKLVEKRKEKILIEKERLIENSKEVMEKIKGMKVVIKAKASDKGKLYASVVEDDVIKAIMEDKNLRLEKEFLKMDHFKEVGEYKLLVEIGDLTEELEVSVEAL